MASSFWKFGLGRIFGGGAAAPAGPGAGVDNLLISGTDSLLTSGTDVLLLA
jgi:hypothetical protein